MKRMRRRSSSCRTCQNPGAGGAFRGSDACSADSSQLNSDQVGNDPFDGSHKSHFKPARPPGANRNKRFGRTHGEMREEGNKRSGDNGWITRQEKERDDG